ncbi:hypothetical protein G3N57_23120 [Paraburkholderia sp. Se-20369]|nr:hypothetical protein [Paraburkholderia sp. Se-20369]
MNVIRMSPNPPTSADSNRTHHVCLSFPRRVDLTCRAWWRRLTTACR